MAEIIYCLAFCTFSALFAYFIFFMCLGCATEDFSSRPTTEYQTAKSSSSGDFCSKIKFQAVDKKGINEVEAAEDAALKTFREVYRDRGVEDVCALDTSESDVDEQDSLFKQMKEEWECIGYRRPNYETGAEEK
ncbi:hypothetical protein BKA65DRAFT_478486 [Rhexocercosporidium sp. MPI-PUGE-AT-0058]|nr:hypothetical protein BKA65DRAFT_478486 [Rhexocercosporidium sp. MPI-PUGE-AT-0058]